jgi:DNA-binding NarL/FixJ family response regulator
VNVDGLMLCDDLIFFSRVAATARASGLLVKQVKTASDLLKHALTTPPACVILDLQNPGLVLTNLLDELRASQNPMPRVIAYGSHVEAETLRAARTAGCDAVMPRSRFVEVLDSQLRDWMRRSEESLSKSDSAN